VSKRHTARHANAAMAPNERESGSWSRTPQAPDGGDYNARHAQNSPNGAGADAAELTPPTAPGGALPQAAPQDFDPPPAGAAVDVAGIAEPLLVYLDTHCTGHPDCPAPHDALRALVQYAHAAAFDVARLTAALAAAEARGAGLAQDTARLDWLEEHGEDVSWHRATNLPLVVELSYTPVADEEDEGVVAGTSLRDVIDHVRSAADDTRVGTEVEP
jgi:hypothetical protein